MKYLLSLFLILFAITGHAAVMTFPVTNYNGTLQTNKIQIQQVQGPVDDGSFLIVGLPTRINLTNGSATNIMLGGRYSVFVEGISPTNKYYFYAPTNDPGIYSFIDTRISGANVFVNSGITKLLAGQNITLSPTNGMGTVTVTASLSGSGVAVAAGTNIVASTNTGLVTINADAFGITNGLASTNYAATVATNASLLIGANATNQITVASNGVVNFALTIGANATNQGTVVSNGVISQINVTSNALLISATNAATTATNGFVAIGDARWFSLTATNPFANSLFRTADTNGFGTSLRAYADATTNNTDIIRATQNGLGFNNMTLTRSNLGATLIGVTGSGAFNQLSNLTGVSQGQIFVGNNGDGIWPIGLWSGGGKPNDIVYSINVPGKFQVGTLNQMKGGGGLQPGTDQSQYWYFNGSSALQDATNYYGDTQLVIANAQIFGSGNGVSFAGFNTNGNGTATVYSPVQASVMLVQTNALGQTNGAGVHVYSGDDLSKGFAIMIANAPTDMGIFAPYLMAGESPIIPNHAFMTTERTNQTVHFPKWQAGIFHHRMAGWADTLRIDETNGHIFVWGNISTTNGAIYTKTGLWATNLTASRALVSDANSGVTNSVTTSTELGYLSGVTSALQTQIDSKPTTSSGVAFTNVSQAFSGAQIITNNSSVISANKMTNTALSATAVVTTDAQKGFSSVAFDANTAHFLNGNGAFTTPAGGSSATFNVNQFSSGSGADGTNIIAGALLTNIVLLASGVSPAEVNHGAQVWTNDTTLANTLYTNGTWTITESNAPATGKPSIVFTNAQPAVLNGQSYTTIFDAHASGWGTTGSAAQDVRWCATMVPVFLILSNSINGAAWTEGFRLNSTPTGGLNIAGNIVSSTAVSAGSTVTATTKLVAGNTSTMGSAGRSVIDFPADGVMRALNNGATLISILQHAETNTVAASTRSLNVLEVGSRINNSGAAGAVIYTLPAAVVGYHFWVTVVTAQNVNVTAVGSDTIRNAGTVSGAAGTTQATAIGSTAHFFCPVAGQWMMESVIGTWSGPT